MQGLQQPGCHWRSCHLWKGGRLGLQRQVRLIHPMPASGPRLPLGPQLWGRWRSSRVRGSWPSCWAPQATECEVARSPFPSLAGSVIMAF